MRASRLVSLLVVPLLAACGGGGDGVVGTWHVDLDVAVDTAITAAESAAEGVPSLTDGDRTRMRDAARKAFAGAGVEFDLRADHTFTGRVTTPTGVQDSVTGTWAERGDVVVLSPAEKGSPVELTRRGDRLEMARGPIRVVLTRSR